MNDGVRLTGLTAEQLAKVRGGEWFAALEPALQRAVLGSSRVMMLAAGESVFRRDDPGDGIYCVVSGAVRFGTLTASGKESIVGLAEPPHWFGEIALFDNGRRTHDASADVVSTLLHLPLRSLTKILADEPSAWRSMGRLLVQKLRIAFSLLEDMALETPRVRLARCLINLFEGYGERKSEPVTLVRVSQERLGAMLSLSRQTINEMLGEMEREAIIQCQRGSVRVLDQRRLREAAQLLPKN
jgi:CRP/FNR family transcriptional regulator, cyclic AMP receptor protein